jgi:membrane protease YdiL (CAAX protease family)
LFELLNLHVFLLPLLGAYYLVMRKKDNVTTPLLLGAVVCLATWVQWGTVYGVLQGVLFGLATFGAATAGYGGKLSLRQWWTGRKWRRGVWLGVVFAGVQLGIGLLVATLAQPEGGTLADESVREVITRSPWPWAVPVAAGAAAGIYEELVYRRLADVWLRRWMPGVAVAMVSSLLWAATHVTGAGPASYRQLLELGLLIGPLSYWFYRRYGLFPAVLAHGIYNSAVVLISEIFLA